MKTGLVLEGGGMRGLFTAGILDVLLEHGIEVDGVVGVSAGAIFGSNYKSRQMGRALRYNTRFCRDPRYVSLRSLLRTGDLYEERFCYHELPNVLDPFDRATYAANPVEFHVVCTDVLTGRAVYHRCDSGNEEDIQWMRASASMPLVSRVVDIGPHRLLDGGIADSIPIEWAREAGYARNIVILTQPAGFRKKRSRASFLLKMLLRRHPVLASAMARRPEIYNRALDRLESLEKAGEVLVLRPSGKLAISRTERDPEKLRDTHGLGVEAARERLEEMRAFLQG